VLMFHEENQAQFLRESQTFPGFLVSSIQTDSKMLVGDICNFTATGLC
jgi:hypothetical protein